MNKTQVEKPRIHTRMQSIECCRLFFSIIVIIAHCLTTDKFGLMMNGIGYVTVPFFFVVSGYFSYNVREKSIKKRFWSVVKLTIAANVLYIFWGAFLEGARDIVSLLVWIKERCSITVLMQMLLISRNSIRSHLWYLNAIVICYAVMWLYVSWAEDDKCDYKPLYIVSVCLYGLHVVLGSFATASGFDIPSYVYRNALLYGIPMFSLGIFLREYYDKIIRAFYLTKTKLIVLFFVGFCLSILQIKGTGKVEMPIGSLIEVISLMLFVIMVPMITDKPGIVSGMISTFGDLSTYIYVVHMVYLDIYIMYIQGYAQRFGDKVEILLCGIIVIGITLITGTAYLGIKAAFRKFIGKRKMKAGTKER